MRSHYYNSDNKIEENGEPWGTPADKTNEGKKEIYARGCLHRIMNRRLGKGRSPGGPPMMKRIGKKRVLGCIMLGKAGNPEGFPLMKQMEKWEFWALGCLCRIMNIRL